MSEPESGALRIGAWVARAGLSTWLDDPRLDGADDLMATLATRIVGAIDRRRLLREFDAIADAVAEHLLALPGLSEDERVRAISAVDNTVGQISLPGRSRWDCDDPARLARLLSGHREIFPAYDVVLRLSCVAVCETLSQLPPDASELADALRRPGAIAAAVGKAMDRQQTEIEEDFTPRYLRFIAESMDRMEFAGFHSWRMRHSLMKGFVAPSVRIPDADAADSQPLVESVANHRRILVCSAAGSGKSTTLIWLAVRAARGELSGLGWSIPVLVRLNSQSNEATDPVQRLADTMSHQPEDPVPREWVRRVLREGTALVLVDGLDELPEPNRSETWEWLHRLTTSFPTARLVVSTRPPRLDDWTDARFHVVELKPFTPTDVEKYVRKWYSTVLPDRGDTHPQELLLDALATNPHLARLATTPLMCSILCAIAMRRTTSFPRNHEIYEAVLQMMLELDGPKGIHRRSMLGYSEKRVLLTQLAYWFLLNKYIEADRKAVVDQINIELENMPQVVASAEQVLNTLIETSAVLRESVNGRIDFLHPTLQEYLAAQAVLNQNATDLLVQLAHEDEWRDVLAMAASQSNPVACQQLITGLLHRAQVETRYRPQLLDLARECMADRPEIRSSALDTLDSRLAIGEPPETESGRHVIFALDIVGFAARTNAHQLALRGALYETLQRAFEQAQCPWERCVFTDTGDGLLIIAPTGQSIDHLARQVPDRLATELQRYNLTRSAEAQARLRMSICEGLVVSGAVGFTGEAVVAAVRLLDTQAVRQALRESTSVLATIMPDNTYRQVNDLMEHYRPLSVTSQKLSTKAWIRLYVGDAHTSADVSAANKSDSGHTIAHTIDLARADLMKRQSTVSLAEIQIRATQAAPARDVLAILRAPGVGIIADAEERAAVRANTTNIARLARQFEDAGACAIRVPTDRVQLGGSWKELAIVRAAVNIPVLCNDFIYWPYQVFEARAHGADMVQLVAAALEQKILVALLGQIEALGMTAVVRVRTLDEADRALEAGAAVISIVTTGPNGNAALQERFARVALELPPRVVRIAEGEMIGPDDVLALASTGAHAVLTGWNRFGSAEPIEGIQQLVRAGEHRWSQRAL
ncbi:NACHT domain-containing protein [Plantactinospora sp. WMMB782]|uniref:NACHT domain-containing protein n=1 Tax=Plantactinospora sp. WMMB782 TaxID=3404121 RepID=UPI003B94AA38